jgi:hypothetical protein
MFKIFKKKDTSSSGADPRIVKLLELFDGLSNEVTQRYSTFERHNPVELRFFTMSAVSVCIQAYGKLPEDEMRATVNTFTDQAIATLILKMPRADFSLLHNAFLDRFGNYCNLIVDVANAQTNSELQDTTFALMTTMDAYLGVERGSFDAALSGVSLASALTEFAGNVRNVFVS